MGKYEHWTKILRVIFILNFFVMLRRKNYLVIILMEDLRSIHSFKHVIKSTVSFYLGDHFIKKSGIHIAVFLH